MAKTYAKKNITPKDLKPSKEVISFLLSYSKALKVVKVKDKNVEIISN